MTSDAQPEAALDPTADTASRIDHEILGGPRRYTLDDLVEGTGLSRELIEDYWRWLGLPVQHATARWFTDSDLESLREIARLAASEHLDEQALRTLVRSMGHTTERLALWQVEAFVEHAAREKGLDDVSARLTVLDTMPHLADVLAHQLEHAWRRQLAAVTGRYATEFAGARSGDRDLHKLPLRRAVGFADIVSFTKRTAGLGSEELSEFVQLFETRARDVVTEAGGRVVKTVGDAVLFIADDVQHGAEVALGLSAPHPDGPEIPVRVGFVWGRVLSRFGDVFGESVNLASRLTEASQPGEVLVDPATAALLATSSRYALTEQPEAELQGLGAMRPVRLQRAYTGA
ncbi:adenylate/guanylate cyclase [Xylanimonas cellulosilytica DSM 15894]|uniref:Adenylate/guanylate cyclase n=1 Tax=Xylanimonas cellulosilytica (strain DSM 15894 / JCM 12276 / CECT 5975 / KCTC 9989 / LMG 20990 / NBRC 107835 / XIL07) TaxID=446471 RepID=D1BYX9_XYLCX|nr:adenylate/guanylate cyclase domain-containing protein [Xylanimonas cellulosilytica]ACZ30054.1 adenylate/guanylate cyclase [Xylanimonas cellulosilytica DSM 15894]